MADATESRCELCGATLGAGGGAGLGLCLACVLRGAAEESPGATARGDFEILGEIARGAMGVVYRVRQVSLGRVVAMKVLLGGAFAGEAGRQRLRLEAAAAARLRHPNIVAVHDAGEWEGQPYYTMAYVEGATLADLLRDGPLALVRATRLAESVARAVHYAHQQGVIHRDLKPSNILIDAVDQPQVTDFGLARAAESAADATLTGTVMGSPAYMAPEQAAGRVRDIGPGSDVYSLGAVLYEMLTGTTPFLGDSTAAVLDQVRHAEPVSPRRLNTSVPVDLETICLKCLEKEQGARYASAAALADDLARFQRGEPVVARPLGPVARGVRWARREPALAAVWLLTATLAMGSSVAAWWISRERDRAVAARHEARESQLMARSAQARAVVRSERPGQRREALAAIADATAIRSTRELRDAALVALTRFDVQLTNGWSPRSRPDASWAVSPDLASEVVETEPGLLTWRGLRGGAIRATLDARGEGEIVHVPVFDATMRHLGAVHAPGRLVIWELGPPPRIVLRLEVGVPGGESRRYRPFDFVPGHAAVVVATTSGALEAYPLDTGRPEQRWPGLGVTNLVRVSPDGGRVAAATVRGLVTVVGWDASRALWTVEGDGPSEAMAWHPDSRELAVATRTGDVQIRRAEDGVLVRELRGHRSRVTALAYSGDGRQLWTRGQDSTLRLWDANTGDSHLVMEDTSLDPDLVIAGDGARAVMSRQWTEATEAEVDRVSVVRRLPPAAPGAEATLTGMMDFHPSGRWLAVATFRGVGVIDVREARWSAWWPRRPRTGDPEGQVACSVQFSPDGARLWVADRTSGVEVREFQTDTAGRVSVGEARLMWAEAGFLVSDVSADGRWVAVIQRDPGAVVVFEAATGAEVRRISPAPQAMIATFTRDSRWLVTQTTGMEKTNSVAARVWSVSDGHEVHAFDVGPLGLVDISDDGRWLAISGERGFRIAEVGRWDRTESLHAEVPDTSAVPSFSPDGEWVAVGISADVYLARVAGGEVVAKLSALGNNGAAARPRFGPGGRTLAVANDDGTVDLWDMEEMRAALGRLGLYW